MAIDKEAIKEHIRGILVALGDDPDREGLKETPDRVAKMCTGKRTGRQDSECNLQGMWK